MSSLRNRLLAGHIVMLLLTLMASAVVARYLDAGWRTIGVAGVVFSGVGAAALAGVEGHHPFARVGIANHVTTMRVALVAMVAGLLVAPAGTGVAWTAALLTLVAVALDGVDGWLARRTGMSSGFGARYDMETDALLILVLAVLAWRQEKAGAWIVLAGALRYLFVAAGFLWAWMTAPLPPSQRRKVVCVVQVAGLGVVVSPLLAAPLSVVVAAATLAALTWSFAVDVLWLRRAGV